MLIFTRACGDRHCHRQKPGDQSRSQAFACGNWTDHDAALTLGFNVAGGRVVADLGYRGEATQDRLRDEADLLLLTKDDVAAPSG